MRGRTLNDSFVILDEAQNTTTEQMKMFLTRLGYGSKAVITGDVTQIDLPAGKVSGLKRGAARSSRDIDGIRFIAFTERDVVRHRLVQDIITAYERAVSARRRRPWRSRPGGGASAGIARAPRRSAPVGCWSLLRRRRCGAVGAARVATPRCTS